MKYIRENYYWITYEDVLCVGYYDRWGSWELCGTEELLNENDVKVISHIERPNL